MRLHIVSLPHTQTTLDYISCAYTSKVRNFATMMKSLDYEVYVYASEENDADVTELITVASKTDQEKWFGEFDYHSNFYPITWEPSDTHWVEMNNNAIEEIRKRVQPDDIICVIAGRCQQQIAQAFPWVPTVEFGIGYSGVFSDFKVFESYSHMHYVYGLMNNDDGRAYDCVIPNFFNPSEFYLAKYLDIKHSMNPYYLFLGRFIPRKGIEIAVEATRQLGVNLVMAGQGCRQDGNKFYGGDGMMVEGDHLSHIGHVDVKDRATLLNTAIATFMPTTYLEPFGGVAVESLLSGTPVIASDFGAFTETIRHGIDGYRFRTVGEAAHYASKEMLGKLPTRYTIRSNAISRYSMDVVKYKYDDYFRQVIGAWNGSADFFSRWHGRDDRYALTSTEKA